jgi:hypothetical protein
LARNAAVAQVSKLKFSTNVGDKFDTDLGNYILKATGVKGEWKPEGDLNDIGDFFVNTVAGTEAASKYLREVAGMDSMTRAEMNSGKYSYDTEGMKDKDGNWLVKWSDIAGYYASERAMEEIDFQ